MEVLPNPPQLNRLYRYDLSPFSYILAENPRIFNKQIEWVPNEANMGFEGDALQKNIEIIGGDPFLNSQPHVLQEFNTGYGAGMF